MRDCVSFRRSCKYFIRLLDSRLIHSTVLKCSSVELQKDKVDVRLKAVELLGRLFAFPGRQFAQDYPLVFSEFLKRFSDKVADVRVAVVNCAKAYVEANPSGEQANEILGEF